MVLRGGVHDKKDKKGRGRKRIKEVWEWIRLKRERLVKYLPKCINTVIARIFPLKLIVHYLTLCTNIFLSSLKCHGFCNDARLQQ